MGDPTWASRLPAMALPAVTWPVVACAALGLAAALAGGPAHADTVTVKSEFTAAAELNPDYQGRPSPVNLIVFQLAGPDAFRNADFFSLYDPDSELLGGDLIGRSQMLVQPGEARELELEVDENARFLGLIAAFRDIENAQWRALVELPDKGFLRRIFSREKLIIELEPLELAAMID